MLLAVSMGLLGGLFSAGGPPLVYHFYRQPMAMEALRATLVAALTTIGVEGSIVGKALYAGAFTLAEALDVASD